MSRPELPQRAISGSGILLQLGSALMSWSELPPKAMGLSMVDATAQSHVDIRGPRSHWEPPEAILMSGF